MEISNNSLNASAIAKNGLNNGYNQLTKQSQSIAESLITPGQQPATVNYEALNQASATPPSSITNNLLNMQSTETQMQSLVKVLEVEKGLFDESLGKIFDGWA